MKIIRVVFYRLALATAVAGLSACSEGMHPRIGIGDRAPSSANRVLTSGMNWRDTCTMDRPDRLHGMQIAASIRDHKPFLVVFGTPQHCTQCVDQMVRIAVMQEKYGKNFRFIHIDGYKETPIWVKWGVRGEPWTFLVDARGIIRYVYPGPTELALLESSISKLVAEDI